MYNLQTKVLKWVVGFGINIGICYSAYFLLLPYQNFKMRDYLVIGGIIQVLLVMPTYLRDVGILPNGSPVQLRGMTRYDVNDNPMFFGIRNLSTSEDVRKPKDDSILTWFFLRRSFGQKMIYGVLMLGIGVIGYVRF